LTTATRDSTPPHSALHFLGHRELNIFMGFPNTQCDNSRDPCTRVKATPLRAIPRKSISAAALTLTPGVKFAHGIAQEFEAIHEIAQYSRAGMQKESSLLIGRGICHGLSPVVSAFADLLATGCEADSGLGFDGKLGLF
jgi:hypothetical protein